MTVKELIEKLQKIDHQDRIIVMASDAEGNSYSPLSGFWLGIYKPENNSSGEVGLEKLTVYDIKCGYTEEDLLEGDKAVILSPIN